MINILNGLVTLELVKIIYVQKIKNCIFFIVDKIINNNEKYTSK